MQLIFVASMMLGLTVVATAQNAGGGRQSGRGTAPAPPALTLTIPGFPDGGHIPVKFTPGRAGSSRR